MAENTASIPEKYFSRLNLSRGDTLSVADKKKGLIVVQMTQKESKDDPKAVRNPNAMKEFLESARGIMKMPSKEDLEKDDRLAYLVNKHLST